MKNISGKGEAVQSGNAVLENDIGLTINGDPFIVRTPRSFCCNCGTKTGVSVVNTRFLKNVYFSTWNENEIDLLLPYCKTCSARVGKYPVSSVYKWVAGFMMWFVLFFLWSLLLARPLNGYPWVVKLFVLGVPPLFPVSWILRFFETPKSPQTSAYTPVIIREYSKRHRLKWGEGPLVMVYMTAASLLTAGFARIFPGKPSQIKQIAINFSNADYAKEFQWANMDLIKRGMIRIL